MDKTLEIVMVAVALVVAAVVVVSMLQERTGNVGEFADQQTDDSGCGLATQRLAAAICEDSSPDAGGVPAYENNDDCWGDESDAEDAACG